MNDLVERKPIVPSKVTEILGAENLGFRAWPVVCASGTCCVLNELSSCVGEAEGELLQEVCEMS